MPHKVMTVYGTRPEAIKVAPVVRALEESPVLTTVTVSTGQHREMLGQVQHVFGIVPDHDLDVFAAGQTLNALMSKIFTRLDPVVAAERPDAVLVQGDTSTAAAAAIVAFNRQVPVVHLEAGLRTGDIGSPFPEEANRRLVSQVAGLHLAPTSSAKANLLLEGIAAASIAVTGNTVIDALVHTASQNVAMTDPALNEVLGTGRPLLLVTMHRRESWDSGLAAVARAVRRLAKQFGDWSVVLPLHRNPVVRGAVLPQLADLPNVLVTEPLPYGEFTRLLAACRIVLTDSGGIQEEAPGLGKPVLVLRDTTERPEAVQAGTVRLVGTDEERIVEETSRLVTDGSAYARMVGAENPYGDGRAARRVRAALEAHLGVGARLPDFAAPVPAPAPAAPASSAIAPADVLAG
ncbi:non-hydrolyzing UDP-N-acetylglucosamine 2-epimerase [Georgenia sp. SUBG003]|uniref:non-hydrolyzing UDP-N-acetylglucosamine 2-epimerase n=1 Tax=Georgenia sp. SUBG003 TaxID=1497974 RepID=UPI0006947F87